MTQRLLAVPLAFALAALPAAAAEFSLAPEAPAAQIAPLPALGALLPALPPAFSQTPQLEALSARLAALPPQAQLTAAVAHAQAGTAAAHPAFLASLEKNLAPLTAADIRRMPAADLEALARRVMDGAGAAPALSAEVPVFEGSSFSPPPALAAPTERAPAAPPAAARALYLLSRPIEFKARLGPLAQTAWVVGEIGFQVAKGYLLWKAGMPAAAVASVMSIELFKTPAMIGAQSMSDLKARYWWKKRGVLKSLAATPGVERIAVLTSAETVFHGVVAARQDNTGLVFLESSKPLEALATPALGVPLRVDDPAAARLRLTFSQDGVDSAAHWTPTLAELLARKPLDPGIAGSWRADIARTQREHSWLKRFFDFAAEKKMKVSAALIDPSGRETELGVLTQGAATKKLLGITRWDAIFQALGAPPRPPRAVPLGDTTVERGARGPLPWRAWPGRLWKLFLARLIVARTP